MHGNITAILRRFPSRKQAIEKLAAYDESFCLLCEDLADAEAALQKWENANSSMRDQRCAEFRELIDDLVKEVEVALSGR